MPSAASKPARAGQVAAARRKNFRRPRAGFVVLRRAAEALAEKIVARNLSVRDAEKLLEGAPESSGANRE
jgi:hypothetical protein